MKPAIPRPGVASPTAASGPKVPTTPTGKAPAGPISPMAKAPAAPGAAGAAKVGSPVKTKPLQQPAALPQGDITFGESTYVFIPDQDQSFLPARVVLTFKQGDDTGVVELLDGKKTTLNKQQTKDCQMMDAQSLETIDNMVEFRTLNEASILHNLRSRYFQDEI